MSASVSALWIAHAMPSPVNGSMYPAASPTNATNRFAGACGRHGIGPIAAKRSTESAEVSHNFRRPNRSCNNAADRTNDQGSRCDRGAAVEINAATCRRSSPSSTMPRYPCGAMNISMAPELEATADFPAMSKENPYLRPAAPSASPAARATALPTPSAPMIRLA